MTTKGLTWTEKFRSESGPIATRKFECRILDSEENVIFEQIGVEAPVWWTDQAVTMFADKYLRGNEGQANRETSVVDVIDRVIHRISSWGEQCDYFREVNDQKAFEQDLRWILANQLASFNSPVWFNLGVPDERQQGSACFILEVQDDMKSIINRAMEEGILFQNGSGSGANNSRLRGSMEPLSRGGHASGPVSFMKGWDAFAGIIKSGGRTRRAAKMEILDCDHPDITEFIRCKWEQEQKAWALKNAGFGSGNINEMDEVFHQNANHSVRVNDEFMQAVVDDKDWNLLGRVGNANCPTGSNLTLVSSSNCFGTRIIDHTSGPVIQTVKARDIWQDIVNCAWECGDPGLFFDDNINEWNTVPHVGSIESSNPCGEFLHPNNTACNLASLNLTKFFGYDTAVKERWFDRVTFEAVVETMITAMDIIAGNADYPTDAIGENSRTLRPLGLGYGGVGHTLMSLGLPYDSEDGRAVMAMTTALMTGVAYRQSSRLMEECKFQDQLNRNNMMRVINLHQEAAHGSDAPSDLNANLNWDYVREIWKKVVYYGDQTGFRNSQVTVLAPTGTISFGMDIAHSTGIEPLFTFMAMKKMAGKGTITLNTSEAVLRGLEATRIDWTDTDAVMDGTLPGYIAESMKDSHVFDTAQGYGEISQAIEPMGHIRMMVAVQPFVSGGISKTVNLPNSATVEDISETYIEAWKGGLKAVALYRDGSKYEQTLGDAKAEKVPAEEPLRRVRKKLPDERPSITHKGVISDQRFYITAGMYPDTGEVAEVFISTAKEGSTVRGLFDTVATLLSICLQYGVPLEELVDKFKDTRFEPNGVTRHPTIPIALSPIDYLFKWLEWKFLDVDEPEEYEDNDGLIVTEIRHGGAVCPSCGGMAVRTGKCHTCTNCGETTGCG